MIERMSIALLALLLAPASSSAQVISGRTADATSGEPVAEADILVRDTTGALVARSMTGESGRFEVRLAAAGQYEVRALRMGYDSAVVRTVLVGPGQTVSLDITMAAQAVPMESVRARARFEEGNPLIAGVVLDALSGDPIAMADVLVRDVRERTVGRAISDEDGRFLVAVSGPGLYRVSVTRLGYDPTAAVNLAVTREQNLYVEVKVSPVALGLDPITATAPPVLPYLAGTGFYERKRRGHGTFLGPSDIERYPGSYPTHLLRWVPGLFVSRGQVQMRGAINFSGGRCSPDIVLDWMILRGISLDDIVPLNHIEAIEVYKSAATVPVQWRSNYTCGLIVVWTKH